MKNKTNIETVTDIMEFGSPMNQIVVMQALDYYTQLCIEKGADHFDNGLINGEAWVAACKDIQEKL